MATGESHSEQVPAYLIIDTESVPDGKLLAMIKYPGENLSPEDAVARAQEEARASSASGSDFLPVTFQYPVAACVLRVGADHSLQAVTCLDAPQYRPRKIVESFWSGVASYRTKYRDRIRLVTFNGRGFDLPLLEMAAFRYGANLREHFHNSRRRYESWHLDLMDWLTNYSAYRLVGGLNLLSKLLGNPGKMSIQGDQVYRLHREGRAQEINDYCMFDTLDTYFVFLRTRVLTGDLTLEEEHVAVLKAKEWIQKKSADLPGLKQYIDNWGDWNPWP
ncbi:MAG: 3'-5' exonuclease [Planctomycetes bacterium]|nr:3'-5' exonuclease [Planctomycetota bacterium]